MNFNIDFHSITTKMYLPNWLKTGVVAKIPSSPHTVYNMGGSPITLREVAEVVPGYIPDATTEFESQSLSLDSAGEVYCICFSVERAKEDFGFCCISLKEAVLIYINETRKEAGLKPLVD